MTDKNNLDGCKEISNLDFNYEGAHLAVVHKLQGGAANGVHEALITKASNVFSTTGTKDITEGELMEVIKKQSDVTVTLSMEDFLMKFFDMWSSDAAVLAKVLGYDTFLDDPEEAETYESYNDMLNKKVESITILKSLNDGFKFLDLPFEQQAEVLLTQEVFEKGLSSVSEAHLNTPPTSEIVKGDKMSEAKLDKVVKSLADMQEAYDAQSEIIKGFKAEKEAQELASVVEVVKAFTFVEDADALAVIVKSLDEDASAKVMAVLEAAKVAIDASEVEIKKSQENMFEATSEEGEGKEEVVKSKQELTAEALAKFNKKES